MEDLKAFVKDSGFAEANDQTHCDLTSGYNIDEEGLQPCFALFKFMDGLIEWPWKKKN